MTGVGQPGSNFSAGAGWAPDRWMGAAQMVFLYGEDTEDRIYQNSQGLAETGRRGYTRLRLKKNTEGMVINAFHYDSLGNLVADHKGVTTYGYVSDSQGRFKRILRFNQRGMRIADRWGGLGKRQGTITPRAF
jgi:hypothetical protein